MRFCLGASRFLGFAGCAFHFSMARAALEAGPDIYNEHPKVVAVRLGCVARQEVCI